MKRYISKRDDKCYTNMLKIINTIGGRNLDYNWLITEIETNTGDYFYDQYIILSNNELKSGKDVSNIFKEIRK